jgi:ABC-2 type transport system permease protein
MKQSVSKHLSSRWRLLKINFVNTWQSETAYFGDAWGNVLSTTIYTLTYIMFVSIIYSNVKLLAGYNRDEMLFLLFLSQIGFYLMSSLSFANVKNMIIAVNRGSFDLLLVKPLPALFYTSLRKISVISLLRDAVPALFFVALALNWGNLPFALPNILAGIIIMVAGQFAMNGFLFLLGLPVFWFGESSSLFYLGYPFTSSDLPYEGVTGSARLVLGVMIPALIPASLAASVMLGKSSAVAGVTIAVAVAILFMALKSFVWKRALLNYSSASS